YLPPCTGRATRSRSRSAWLAASRNMTSATPRSSATGRSRNSAPCVRTTGRPDCRTMLKEPLVDGRFQHLGRAEPCSGERVVQHDGVLAIRPGGHQRKATAGKLLHRTQIGTRRGWQLVPVADTGRRFLPTRELEVDRLALVPAVSIERRQLTPLAAIFVGDADLDGIQPVQHIELGDRQAIDAVDLCGTLQCNQVDPAAATRAAGAGTELVAFLAQQFAHLVVELGRERSAADARRIGLADAEHVVDVLRTHAGAGQRATDRGVARRDIGIGAVVDVEQRALRALVQDVAAFLAHVVQDGGNVVDQRTNVLAPGQRIVQYLLVVDRLGLQPLGEDEVVIVDRGLQQRWQFVRIHQVSHANRATGDLVLVGRADAAAGGTDGLATGGDLARLVHGNVVRHDQWRGRADLDPRTHLDAIAFQLADLLDQRLRRQHHAVADQAQGVVAQDARRDQVQHGLLALDHQRMAGVVAALETHHRADPLGQQVDDLALAFVAPLRTQNDY